MGVLFLVLQIFRAAVLQAKRLVEAEEMERGNLRSALIGGRIGLPSYTAKNMCNFAYWRFPIAEDLVGLRDQES